MTSELNSPKRMCPACGFPLPYTPWDGDQPSHNTCPCCAIQFGFDDVYTASGQYLTADQTYSDWRSSWIVEGMPWRGYGTAPTDWDPVEQALQVFANVQEAGAASATDPWHERTQQLPRRFDSYVRARRYYLRPGLAWVQRDARWHLIESKLGHFFNDDDFARALELIVQVERSNNVSRSFGQRVLLVPRLVSLPMYIDPIEINIDAVVDEDLSEEDQTRVESWLSQDMDAHYTRTRPIFRSRLNITFYRFPASSLSLDDPRLYADKWFWRFFSDGNPF